MTIRTLFLVVLFAPPIMMDPGTCSDWDPTPQCPPESHEECADVTPCPCVGNDEHP